MFNDVDHIVKKLPYNIDHHIVNHKYKKEYIKIIIKNLYLIDQGRIYI